MTSDSCLLNQCSVRLHTTRIPTSRSQVSKRWCYRYEELFAEKGGGADGAVAPARPLRNAHPLFPDTTRSWDHRELVVSTLKEKCAFKGIPLPTVAGVTSAA